MLCILNLVCLCVSLLGFNVDKWCLCVILESGFVWFINWLSCEELKNFWIVVVVGFVLIRLCGMIVLIFMEFICFLIVCFMWSKLRWYWFFISLFIECIWWLFKWLMLLIFLCLFCKLMRVLIIVRIFFLCSILIVFLVVNLRCKFIFIWLILFRLYFLDLKKRFKNRVLVVFGVGGLLGCMIW